MGGVGIPTTPPKSHGVATATTTLALMSAWVRRGTGTASCTQHGRDVRDERERLI